MDVLLRKSTFCPKLTQILNFEETETHYWKSLKMAHSWHFKWRNLTPNFFKFHVRGGKCRFRNCQFGTFDPVHEIWNLLCLYILIWSAMNVPLLKFFDNVSQSLQNSEFVSILGKKWIFSIGHPYSIFKLVS
jgi:hypothetical protein